MNRRTAFIALDALLLIVAIVVVVVGVVPVWVGAAFVLYYINGFLTGLVYERA